MQPLDVCINAPFKKKVDTAATQHLNDNLEKYLNGKFTAGERQVLLTKCSIAGENRPTGAKFPMEIIDF